MLQSLRVVRGIGQFDAVTGNPAARFDRLTVVYGENGCGKTTLTAILRSLCTGSPLPISERTRLGASCLPEVAFELAGMATPLSFTAQVWSATLPEIVIFDDLFVEENIYSGLQVSSEQRHHLHELILGTQGVELAREFGEITTEIAALNKELLAKTRAIPEAARGSFAMELFCALPPQDDLERDIAAAERRMEALSRADAVRTTPLFPAIALPAIDLPTLDDLLARGLPDLDAEAVSRVGAHFARLGEGGERWVAGGMEKLGVENGPPCCPFCAQDLRGSAMVTHYRAYFSSAYDALKREIAAALRQYEGLLSGDALAAFGQSVHNLLPLQTFWGKLIHVPTVAVDLPAVSTVWKEAREALLQALQAKQAAPLDPIITLPVAAREAFTRYALMRDEVAAIDTALQGANADVNLLKMLTAGDKELSASHTLSRLRAVQQRYSPAYADLAEEYLAMKAEKEAAEARKAELRRKLDTHRERVFPVYQQRMNHYLEAFNAGYRIVDVKPIQPGGRPSTSYQLAIGNTKVPLESGSRATTMHAFKNVLSAGDRNTLALAFFFTALDHDPHLAQRIVVIDDPISSLDDQRALATIRQINQLATQAAQVFVLSHDRRFLRQLLAHSAGSPTATLEVRRTGSSSTIGVWDVRE